MTVEVIIPFAGGCPHRARALDYVVGRYPWPVTVATGPGGAWCKAAAVMPAVRNSSADVVVVADADVFCDGIDLAIERAYDGHAWCVPHRGVHRLTTEGTEAVYAGESPLEQSLDERAYLGLVGGGIVVAHRAAILSVPMDSRFVGWGQEDQSWGLALTTLLDVPWRGHAPLWHLWHPAQPRLSRKRGSDASWRLFDQYRHARHSQARMRALLAEIGGPHDAHSVDEPRLRDHAA